MNPKNRQIIISAVIVLVIIAGATWYTLTQKEPTSTQQEVGTIEYPENFFDLTVYDENIPPEKLTKWQERFETASSNVKNSPDGFHFAGVLDMGAIKKYVGDYEGARDIWIFMGEQRPLNSISFGNLGDLYAGFLKEPENAEAAYLKAIENDPEDINFYINLSDLYRYEFEGGEEKVKELLTKGVEANPEQADLFTYTASFYSEIGENEKAIEYFEKAIELNPNNQTVIDEVKRLKSL